MKSNLQKKLIAIIVFGIAMVLPTLSFAKEDQKNSATVAQKIFEKAEANDNWKAAFLTGKHGQVVFMSVSPLTNPNNEIGMETHPFDQVIIIASGDGKAVLDGKERTIKTGDMIFIPLNIAHNVINLNKDKALKIISFYSSNDIPANSVYKKKTDE